LKNHNETEPYILFRADYGLYGLRAPGVTEIRKPGTITTVPGASSEVEGIMNVRGSLLTVLNARVLLGLPRQELSPQSRIIVLSQGDSRLGLLVERVKGSLRAAPDQIMSSFPEGTGLVTGFLKTEEDELVRLLHIPLLYEQFQFTGEHQPPLLAPTLGDEAYARLEDEDDQAGSRHLYIQMQCGDERFGLPAREIRGIMPMPDRMETMPHSPRWLMGSCLKDQQIIPVLDSAYLLGVRSQGKPGYIVLLEKRMNGLIYLAGLAADHVLEPVQLEPDSICSLPVSVEGCTGNGLAGVHVDKESGSLLLILDTSSLVPGHIWLQSAEETPEADSYEDWELTYIGHHRSLQESCLMFRLQGEDFGVPAGAVRRIVHPPALLPVPGAECYIAGITNIHGHLVTAVNLGALMECKGGRTAGETGRFIMLEAEGRYWGFEVDRIYGLEPYASLNVPEPQTAGSWLKKQRLLSGIAADTKKGLVKLLELEFISGLL
jgi:purine-binding chemotaxis protein CheW